MSCGWWNRWRHRQLRRVFARETLPGLVSLAILNNYKDASPLGVAIDAFNEMKQREWFYCCECGQADERRGAAVRPERSGMIAEVRALKRGPLNVGRRFAPCGRCGASNAYDGSSRCDCDEVDAALEAYAQSLERPSGWQGIETAPKDGTAFLAFGIHDHSPPDAARGVKAGDHWWAIVLWDIWTPRDIFVFAKDGKGTWSFPTHWMPLPSPPEVK